MLHMLSRLAIKFKWPIVVFWIVLAAIVFWKAPALSDVAKTDDKSFLSAGASPVKAEKLLKQLYPDKGGGSSLVLTLQRKGGITNKDRAYARYLENYLVKNQKVYKIRGITSPFSQKEFEKTMMTKNGEVALVAVNLAVPSFSEVANEVSRSIGRAVKPKHGAGRSDAPSVPAGLTVNITGDAAIAQEKVDAIQESMMLTGKVTVLLVAIILVIIYRSPVAPLLPLSTIGLSFLISRGLIASSTFLGLKVSAFTETFLIAILFGAGTDYCLLIISRFREEISSGKTAQEALDVTLPYTGESILSSGGTVIVGFAFMIFAKFGLFNTTGPSIAIGVAITILAAMTLTPALLAISGERVFWPAHPSRNLVRAVGGAGESSFWDRLSDAVTSKPLRFIAACLIILTPFLISTRGIIRTFDQLAELPKTSDAAKGFQVLKNNFDQGELLPIKIVIKTDKNMWSNESLQTLDRLADRISRIGKVARVRTATRPLGDTITELSLPGQIEKFSGGLGQIETGFKPVVSGLDRMNSGVKQVAGGISRGSGKLNKLAASTGRAENGIAEVRGGLNRLDTGAGNAISGLNEINRGLGALSAGAVQSSQGVGQIKDLLQQVQTELESLATQKPELASDSDFQKAYATTKGIVSDIGGVSSGLGQLRDGLSDARAGISNVSEGLAGAKDGIHRSDAALSQIQSGLKAMKGGQARAGSELTRASSSLTQITTGFNSSQDALLKMQSGVKYARESATTYSSSKDRLDEVFFLPPGTLEKYPNLRNAMEYYIAPGGNGVILDVVLSVPPYTNEALDKVEKIKRVTGDMLEGSSLAGSEFYVGGGTSTFNEIRQVTASDLINVMIFVLLGIFVILVVLLRSFIAPIYLILTILLSFAATLGITGLVFQGGLGHEGLDWSVPFFAFCLLVALGVDYNIFLMSRVKEEYSPGDVKGSVARALSSTGKIITSCGIIMAGTFGALMASPLYSLVEIGFATVVGLLLDTFIIRTLLVPAIAIKVGELNWWPGRKVKIVPVEA